MTTVNLQVNNGNGDADERESGADFDGTGNRVNCESNTNTSRFNAGFYFASVILPKGAQIISAFVKPYIRGSDDADLDIHAEAVDNAVHFVTNADVTSRVRSATSVAWVADNLGTPGETTSPDITTVIQEHVDRAGWASGNGLVILFIAKASAGDKWLSMDSYESTPSNACKLDITYAVHRKRSYARAIL